MAKVSRFRSAGGKNNLLENTKKSYESRESSGKYQNFLKGGLPIPEWKCKGGDHIVDIIPFLAGDLHPTVKEGFGAYNIDVYVHMGVGVNENAYICPARNYGKPCPICERAEELKKTVGYDEKYVKSLNPKRRVVYNIICYDSQEEINKGVQVWEASHFLTEKLISAVAKNRRTGGFVEFSDPDMDKGKSVEWTREGSGVNTKHNGTKFTDRDYDITDEELDTALTLDQWIKIATYDELENAFYGSDADAGTTETGETGDKEAGTTETTETTEETAGGYDPDKDGTSENEAQEDAGSAEESPNNVGKTPTEIKRTARKGVSRTISRKPAESKPETTEKEDVKEPGKRAPIQRRAPIKRR